MTAMPDALQDALKLLPHGPEFRFVDRLVSMVPGKEGVGEYLVRGDEFYLRGHLPGEPLFPGVLLVEAAAQLAGVVAQNDPAIPSLPGLKLTALRAVKILGTARPGETVRMAARIIARLGLLVQAKVSASVGRVEVMTAELTLSGTATAGPAGAQESGHDKLAPHRGKA
jgi:3-hydroxyacyl-[acyl-carrier-protein] dehydratase